MIPVLILIVPGLLDSQLFTPMGFMVPSCHFAIAQVQEKWSSLCAPGYFPCCPPNLRPPTLLPWSGSMTYSHYKAKFQPMTGSFLFKGSQTTLIPIWSMTLTMLSCLWRGCGGLSMTSSDTVSSFPSSLVPFRISWLEHSSQDVHCAQTLT